jgi:hypothetical protein
MVITSSTRSILSSALIALTGPLPIHKSKSVLRAAFLAKRKAEREQCIPFAHGAEDSHKWESESNKPKSQRTYYLGLGGLVSQRIALVGDLHATCRAHDTAEALDKFTQSYRARECQPLFAPFVKGH